MAIGRLDDTDVMPAEAAEMLEDLRVLGAADEVIEKTRLALVPATRDQTFLVHPVNAVPVKLFLALQTQWREVGTMSRVIKRGLDYGVIQITAELEELAPINRDDFRRLRIMEVAALNAWSEASK